MQGTGRFVAGLALALLPSCTIYMWSEDEGWWLISREEYEHIDAAALDAGGTLYLRIARAHASPQLWTACLTAAGSDKYHTVDARLVADVPLPQSTANVRVLSGEPGTDTLFGTVTKQGILVDADYLVFLSGHRADVCVVVIDARLPETERRFRLPDPDIAWLTPNAMGHVVLTPVAVVFDVACLPIYVVVGGLMLTGVMHTH
jgi:hypothetical protein